MHMNLKGTLLFSIQDPAALLEEASPHGKHANAHGAAQWMQ